MHNLCIMWLYAFLFVICKVSEDALFVIFQTITCKIVSFVFGATFAASNRQFIGICNFVIGV